MRILAILTFVIAAFSLCPGNVGPVIDQEGRQFAYNHDVSFCIKYFVYPNTNIVKKKYGI